MQHTPEPWRASPRIQEGNVPGAGRSWALFGQGAAAGREMPAQCSGPDAEANARRIAACVNACAGIDDPEAAVPRLLGALRRILDDAPSERPEYDDWGGDTERAEVWGGAAEHWRCADIARRALGAHETA